MRAGVFSALLLGTIIVAGPAQASSKKVGTSGATFLRMEQGARAVGMGGAFSAVADDASSLWWNPAGIARSTFTDVILSHTAFIEDITSQVVGVARPAPKLGAVIGLSATYLSIDGIQGYDASKNPTGDLDATGISVGLAVAKSFGALSFGGQGKMIQETLHDKKGSGFAVDAGLQYHKDKLGIGVALQNVGPKFKIGTKSDPLPRVARAGVSYQAHPKIQLAVDGEKPDDADFKLHLGGEGQLTPMLAVRAGYQNLKNVGDGAGYSMGFGLKALFGGDKWSGSWSKSVDEVRWAIRQEGAYLISFDYAFLTFGDFDTTHRATLGVRF